MLNSLTSNNRVGGPGIVFDGFPAPGGRFLVHLKPPTSIPAHVCKSEFNPFLDIRGAGPRPVFRVVFFPIFNCGPESPCEKTASRPQSRPHVRHSSLFDRSF